MSLSMAVTAASVTTIRTAAVITTQLTTCDTTQETYNQFITQMGQNGNLSAR